MYFFYTEIAVEGVTLRLNDKENIMLRHTVCAALLAVSASGLSLNTWADGLPKPCHTSDECGPDMACLKNPEGSGKTCQQGPKPCHTDMECGHGDNGMVCKVNPDGHGKTCQEK